MKEYVAPLKGPKDAALYDINRSGRGSCILRHGLLGNARIMLSVSAESFRNYKLRLEERFVMYEYMNTSVGNKVHFGSLQILTRPASDGIMNSLIRNPIAARRTPHYGDLKRYVSLKSERKHT